MAKTEVDILRYISGEMSSEEIEDMQQWVSKKPKNARKVEILKQITENAEHLPAYRAVDVDSEWDQFIAKRKAIVSELDLLYLSDGTADYATRSKLEQWRRSSSDNGREFAITEKLGAALVGLKNYQPVNADTQWTTFLKSKEKVIVSDVGYQAPMAQEQAPTESSAPSKGRTISMWMRYAAAATVAMLITAGAWWMRPQPTTITYATTNQTESIELPDGSIVHLDPNSELTYFRDVDKVNQRDVLLHGSATFDVVPVDQKPFEVKTNDDIGISVLGTIFSIRDDATYKRLIKNDKGRVKAFSVSDPSIEQILEEGDEVGFDGSGFNIILPEPVKNEEEFEVLYVLDHIMRTSGWKVITKPNTAFKPGAKVFVDLNQPYEEIMADLTSKGLLEYRDLACSGCYEISRFTGE